MKKPKVNLLKIGPSLTIDNTPELLASAQKIHAQNKPLQIQSEFIDNIDLSGIQLLHILKNTKFKGEFPDRKLKFSDNAKDLIIKSGFAALIIN